MRALVLLSFVLACTKGDERSEAPTLTPAPVIEAAPIAPQPQKEQQQPKTRWVSHLVNGQVVIEEVPVEQKPPTPGAGPTQRQQDAAHARQAAECSQMLEEIAAAANDRAPPTAAVLQRSREIVRVCKTDPTVRKARARILVAAARAHNDPEARVEMLAEAAELEPTSDNYILLGNAADDNNQLSTAIDAYRRAVELGDPIAKRMLEHAERRFKVEGNFDRRANQFFVARFEGDEQKQLADTVLDELEQARKRIGEKLGLFPEKPINVVIYTGRQYQDALNAPDWSGGLFDGQIRVREGDVRAARGQLRDLLFHEYVHAALRLGVKGEIPSWLHEGLAQRLEPGEDHAAILRRLQGKKASELPTIAQLTGSFAAQRDGNTARLFYACALDLVDELARWRGESSFRSLFEAMNQGKTFEDALDDVYGLDLALLEQRWKSRY